MYWTKLSEKKVPAGWRNIIHRNYLLPNGNSKTYHILENKNSVAVLPITEFGFFLLVEQFRPGPQIHTLELPAGIIDSGELAFEAAERELLEETGYKAEELCFVGRTHCGVYISGYKYLFAARGCKRVQGQRLEDDGVINLSMGPCSWLREQLRQEYFLNPDNGYKTLDWMERNDWI